MVAYVRETPHMPPDEIGPNAVLLALAPTAPHACEDPNCPGGQNAHKLVAFPKLLAEIERLQEELEAEKEASYIRGREDTANRSGEH